MSKSKAERWVAVRNGEFVQIRRFDGDCRVAFTGSVEQALADFSYSLGRVEELTAELDALEVEIARLQALVRP